MMRSAAQVRSDIAERVSVDENGCWVWTLSLTTKGYANTSWVYQPGRRHFGGHRISYIVHVGPIAAGLQIDHLCRNRACVNPEHLEAVDARTNTLRSPISPTAINAAKDKCLRGHPLSGDNLYVSDRVGERRRVCRACQRAAARKYRLTHIEAVADLQRRRRARLREAAS